MWDFWQGLWNNSYLIQERLLSFLYPFEKQKLKWWISVNYQMLGICYNPFILVLKELPAN